ncbi:MAG: alpha/beta hydrolase [Pseudomonadota bacterium]
MTGFAEKSWPYAIPLLLYRRHPPLVALLALLLLPSCSAVDAVNALTPTESIESIQTAAYADGPRHSLDIYTPKDPKPDAPILVFIYGGGWDSGEKGDYLFAAEAFTSAGYTVVVPDYRLYPEVIYPSFVQDAALAVAWTAEHFDGRALVLMGHSAGAHIALHLALETEFLADAGVDRCSTIAGAAGLSGPYGAVEVTTEPHLSIFPERLQGDDAPLTHVSKAVPPVYLATGLRDERVYPKNTLELAAALEGIGADVTLNTYPELDHVDTAKLLSHFFDDNGPVRSDLLAFLDKRRGADGPFCLKS